jgi:hypothetical protein
MQASVAAGLLTGRRAIGASVLPLFCVVVVGVMRLPSNKWRREVARPALCKSAGHWVGKPARELAFEAVSRPSDSVAVRRPRSLAECLETIRVVICWPGPRHTEESSESPSASLRLCVSAIQRKPLCVSAPLRLCVFGWVGFVISSCLCVFVVVMESEKISVRSLCLCVSVVSRVDGWPLRLCAFASLR